MMTLNSAIPILPAVRLEESVAFYQRLGFAVGYDDGDYATLNRDGAESVQEPAQRSDPDKRGGVKDAGGTTWWIATQVG